MRPVSLKFVKFKGPAVETFVGAFRVEFDLILRNCAGTSPQVTSSLQWLTRSFGYLN
jgi:hypothetical protein